LGFPPRGGCLQALYHGGGETAPARKVRTVSYFRGNVIFRRKKRRWLTAFPASQGKKKNGRSPPPPKKNQPNQKERRRTNEEPLAINSGEERGGEPLHPSTGKEETAFGEGVRSKKGGGKRDSAVTSQERGGGYRIPKSAGKRRDVRTYNPQ